MYFRTVTRQSLKVALMSGLLLAGAFAGAPVSAQELPLTRTAKDSQLKWGPCPEFLPKGCAISVLHGDPAQNNADIFLKVPANSVLPRHWHTSVERMVLVSGELHVTYDGHKTAILKPGTYAYGPAKLPHKAECKKAGPCVLFIAFELPVDAVPSEVASKK
jgi:mannose-6-phosphate isomerase-like protein (cupin superfamily)